MASPPRADLEAFIVQEARLLADLDHPNLARVYDVDFWDDRPFVVMEYVRGRTLAEWLQHERPKPRQPRGRLLRSMPIASRQASVSSAASRLSFSRLSAFSAS